MANDYKIIHQRSEIIHCRFPKSSTLVQTICIMKKSKNTRRAFVKNTVAGFGLLSLPSLLNAQTNKQTGKKKIICAGGHPDDPESGCGGTLAKFANAGHDISIIYLTTGEAGIEGKTHDEAAAIRKQEAINAC